MRGDAMKLELVRGDFALIDDADMALALPHKWYSVGIRHRLYCQAYIGGRNVYLHRLLLAPAPGMLVDHINGNGLDNRRGNLRLASFSQNNMNRAHNGGAGGFRGVYQNPKGGRFYAKLMFKRKNLYGGSYDTPEEAARAYDDLARQHAGEFAVLNFPEERLA